MERRLRLPMPPPLDQHRHRRAEPANQQDDEAPKPQGLIPGGQDPEGEGCPRLIPDAVGAARADTEGVRAGAEPGVIGPAAGTYLSPGGIFAFEPIAELDPLGNRETRGGVVDFEITAPRRNGHRVGGPVLTPVDPHDLDQHRRLRTARKGARVHAGHAAVGRHPDPAVRASGDQGTPSRRDHPGKTIEMVEAAIANGVAGIRDRALDLPGSNLKHSGDGRHPPPALLVFGHPEDRPSRDALAIRQGPEPAAFELADPVVADGPDAPAAILEKAPHIGWCQALRGGEKPDLSTIVQRHSVSLSDPEPSLTVAEQDGPQRGRLRERSRQDQAVMTHPKQTQSFIEHPHGSGRIHGELAGGVNADAGQPKGDESPALEPEDGIRLSGPDVSSGILDQVTEKEGAGRDRLDALRTDSEEPGGVESSGPDRGVPGGEDEASPNRAGNRDGGEGAFPKAFQAPLGCYPDIAFPVFQESHDDVRREAFGLGEMLGLGTELGDRLSPDPGRIEDPAETVASRSDPEASLPVDQEGLTPDHHLRRAALITEPAQSVRRSAELTHPDGAVPGLGKVSHVGASPERHVRVDEFGPGRGAVDDAAFGLHPEHIVPVIPDRPAFLSGKPPFGADVPPLPVRKNGEPLRCSGHECAGAGLRQLESMRQPVPLSIHGEPAIAEVADRAAPADQPQASIASRQQAPDPATRKAVAALRQERYESHSVEADQAGERSYPEVPVPGLRQGQESGGGPVLRRPGRVDPLGNRTDGRGVRRGDAELEERKPGQHWREGQRSWTACTIRSSMARKPPLRK